MKICPYCKGTDFSITISATQEFDGEIEEWGDIENIEIETMD